MIIQGSDEWRRMVHQVRASLQEDRVDCDITANLIDSEQMVSARVIVKESAICCGQAWFNAVFSEIDAAIQIDWQVEEGQGINTGDVVVVCHGSARNILTAERCALNWLQTLSAVATRTNRCLGLLQGSDLILRDTRKTIPGLRHAEKYAVRVGGGQNHRLDLAASFLIKENHISSCGSIKKAVEKARSVNHQKVIEVEVETLSELQQALDVAVDEILLDNFSLEMMREAVSLNHSRAFLEVSGNIGMDDLIILKDIGVQAVAMGALTKNITAIDFSLLID